MKILDRKSSSLRSIKARGIDPKKLNIHLFASIAAINNTGKAVFPDDLDYAEYDSLPLCHGTFSGTQPSLRHRLKAIPPARYIKNALVY